MEQANPIDLGFDPNRLSRIERWMTRSIEAGKIPGAITAIAREGRLVFVDCQGLRDVEAGEAMTRDTILRFYSMTKPVTAVAFMMLLEEGLVRLDDPLALYIPEFADLSVYDGTVGADLLRKPLERPVTLHHILTHTAGFTYGFMADHPVCDLYKEAGLNFDRNEGTLAERMTKLADLPLVCQPGEKWIYSVASDILGRVIEVVSGVSLADFFSRRIFVPLGMTDTGFDLTSDQRGRFAALYGPKHPSGDGSLLQGRTRPGGLVRLEGPDAAAYDPPATCFSGGGGLLSTLDDYLRFAEMLRLGGAHEGERLLGPRTVDFMTQNHLPGGVDLAAMGQARFSEISFSGIGFGLGFSVVLDPAQAGFMASSGEFAWGGAASTYFFVDPQEELVVLYLTQLAPSDSYPLRQELRNLVYQALVD